MIKEFLSLFTFWEHMSLRFSVCYREELQITSALALRKSPVTYKVLVNRFHRFFVFRIFMFKEHAMYGICGIFVFSQVWFLLSFTHAN